MKPLLPPWFDRPMLFALQIGAIGLLCATAAVAIPVVNIHRAVQAVRRAVEREGGS